MTILQQRKIPCVVEIFVACYVLLVGASFGRGVAVVGGAVLRCSLLCRSSARAAVQSLLDVV
jgi:hypothetical protein